MVITLFSPVCVFFSKSIVTVTRWTRQGAKTENLGYNLRRVSLLYTSLNSNMLPVVSNWCFALLRIYFLSCANLSKIIRFAKNYKVVNLSLSSKGNHHVVLTSRREAPHAKWWVKFCCWVDKMGWKSAIWIQKPTAWIEWKVEKSNTRNSIWQHLKIFYFKLFFIRKVT